MAGLGVPGYLDKTEDETALANRFKFNLLYRGSSSGSRYRGLPSVTPDMIISPRSQWEEYICPCCDTLMNDPVLTSCGHRMCYECFDGKKLGVVFNVNGSMINYNDSWCPVRDDDGQEHKMSLKEWSKDRTAEWKINKLLVKCDKCKVEYTVKRYRKFDCSTAHDKGINSILINPRSQWEECICPCCDELMNDPVRTSCGHRMCYKCFDKRRWSCGDPWCPVRDDDGQEHKMDDWSKDRTAEWKINKLLVKCDKCEVKCTVKDYRKFKCSTKHQDINSIMISPRSQWEEYICPCCDELMNYPVLTSCGHRMCYKCFNWRLRGRRLFDDPWCPVKDDDGQAHKMSRDHWSKDRTAEWNINKLLVKCEKCEVECTMKRFRNFNCSTAHQGIKSILISPRSQWEEYICPCCDELMNDPVLTSCGHRMCHKCFNGRRWMTMDGPWCPVRDDDGQEHKMSRNDYFKDKAARRAINNILAQCEICQEKCTVKKYRCFHRCFHSTINMTQEEFNEFFYYLATDCKDDIPHWRELLLQDGVIEMPATDDELFVKILPTKGCKGLSDFHNCLKKCDCNSCRQLMADMSNLNILSYSVDLLTLLIPQMNKCSTATVDTYTKLASMKTFRELEKLPPDQQQKLITQVLKETLPAAKGDVLVDKMRPLLYQNGIITNEEATELFGVFTGEEKITKLYTEMLPKKGAGGLRKFMRILYDTGWDTPSHMRHHGVLSIKLSEKLSLIKSAESVFCQYKSEKAAMKAILPMVYSESLQDAVINLSTSINKLLLPMLKKHILSTTDYCWLRGACYRGKRLELLYKEILPQKEVKGLKAFMEILQDVGRKMPKYQKHLDTLKSKLQAHLSKS